METTVLASGGMKSEDDLRAVHNAIQDLPHICQVDISFERGVVTIQF